MADSERFELSLPLRGDLFSRQAVSASHPTILKLAEKKRFELLEPFGSPAFQASALGLYATSPLNGGSGRTRTPKGLFILRQFSRLMPYH